MNSASSVSLIPLTNRTLSPRASSADEPFGRPAGGGLADHGQLGVAFRGQLGHRPQQRRDALHGGVGAGHGHDPAGHARRRPGVEQAGVHPERDHVHAGAGHPEVAADVVAGGLEPVSTGPTRRATRPCIRTNPYHRRLDSRDRPAGRGQLDPPVHADRVVDAGDQRQAEAGDAEHAVGEHLVVVHDVEVGARGAQRAQRAQAERQRLGERRRSTWWRPRARRSSRGTRSAAGCGTGRAPGTGPGWAGCAAAGPAQARDRAGRRTPRRGGRARPARGTGAAGRCPGRRSAACSGRTAARRAAARSAVLGGHAGLHLLGCTALTQVASSSAAGSPIEACPRDPLGSEHYQAVSCVLLRPMGKGATVLVRLRCR